MNATRITVATFGALAALAGIEHGIGEILQGNVSPDGIVILSWPDSAFFRILGGEPAMTLLPTLWVSGVLTILVSLIFLVWAILFVQTKHGGLILMLLSVVLLLVGGGFGPPVLGVIVGAAATRLNAPLKGDAYLAGGIGRVFSVAWKWLYAACLVAWLWLFPGLSLLDLFLGSHSESLVYGTILLAFGSLALTIWAAFVHDAGGRSVSPRAAS